MRFLKLQHPNSLKALKNKEKAAIWEAAACIGDPNGWPQARMPLGILAEETQWDFLLQASDNAAKQQN